MQTVTVIVAARNAEGTVAQAVRSALAQAEVAEIVVVDDASIDRTAEAARGADDGTGRLRIERLLENRGPSAARNLAIERSRSDGVAILDADDVLLPGRFSTLLRQDEWDLVADNIAFVAPGEPVPAPPDGGSPRVWPIGLEAFVEANTPRKGRQRREWGFLKPLMRRSFLDRHGLRYDEALRFGEDYDLYCRALLHHARFKLVSLCGYCAVISPGSLSHSQSTADLERLLAVDDRLLESGRLAPGEKDALERHRQALQRQVWLRRFLDAKRRNGLVDAVRARAGSPGELASVAAGVARDKVEDLKRRLGYDGGRQGASRFLFEEPH